MKACNQEQIDHLASGEFNRYYQLNLAFLEFSHVRLLGPLLVLRFFKSGAD